jgi:hypothetical protein
VHAPAPPPRTARRSAEELGDKLPRLQTLGERVPVPPMRAENDVLGSQVATNPGGDRLLADIGVAGPVHEAPLVATGQLLFAQPDHLHRAVKPEPRFSLRTQIDSSRHGSCRFEVRGPEIRALFCRILTALGRRKGLRLLPRRSHENPQSG